MTDTLYPPLGIMRTGLSFEYRVAARFIDYGWRVAFTGQGNVPEWLREALQPISECGLRYQPDLVVARCDRVFGIDAKASEPRSGYPLELAEYNAHSKLELAWRIPIWYVFADKQCVSLATVQLANYVPGPQYGNGSGKPYLLIPRESTTPFHVVFGDGAVTS